MTKLQPSQIVHIYHDPLTCQKAEGRAILHKMIRPDEGDGLSLWLVRFVDETDAWIMGDPTVIRCVNAKHIC